MEELIPGGGHAVDYVHVLSARLDPEWQPDWISDTGDLGLAPPEEGNRPLCTTGFSIFFLERCVRVDGSLSRLARWVIDLGGGVRGPGSKGGAEIPGPLEEMKTAQWAAVGGEGGCGCWIGFWFSVVNWFCFFGCPYPEQYDRDGEMA